MLVCSLRVLASFSCFLVLVISRRYGWSHEEFTAIMVCVMRHCEAKELVEYHIVV